MDHRLTAAVAFKNCRKPLRTAAAKVLCGSCLDPLKGAKTNYCRSTPDTVAGLLERTAA